MLTHYNLDNIKLVKLSDTARHPYERLCGTKCSISKMATQL